MTNLSNGRQLVVRVNDRGPYTPVRIIDLTRAAADRLNISNNTKVRVDSIQVAPDSTLTGPGTVSPWWRNRASLYRRGRGRPDRSRSRRAVRHATRDDTAPAGQRCGFLGSPTAAGRFMVQVGAIGDTQRAASWQKSLSNRFNVPGRVSANGNLFRVQLGPFQSRQLVQRLQSEAQQPAFITAQ